MNVRTMMRRAARNFGEREAIVAEGRRLTFGEAWERGIRLANGLLEQGLEPGDRVGVIENNGIGAADFLLACTVANLVRVPLYPRNARESHAHMLGHTGCKLVVAAEDFATEVKGLEGEVESLAGVLVRDAGYEDFIAAQSTAEPDPAVEESDYYIIRHTAGTTGRSKGVSYTHRQWLDTARDWFFSYPPIELGDVCLHVGPISHGSGYFFTPMWMCGGVNLLLGAFEPAATVDVIEREGVGYMFAVPTILSALAREPSGPGRDYSKLKMICVGGSPISEASTRRSFEVFGEVVYQVFGQTEAMPATTISPREWLSEVEGSNPLRSAGRAVPFVEVEILDPETAEILPPNSEGEIAVRADGMMKQFWSNPEATEERCVNGWVLSGDVGMLDDNGYLYILDRKDDMIISGGFNIYPAELENVISEHPLVVEVAVFPIPSERWGETPAAVCVVEDPGAVTAEEIVELVSGRLGSYKKPSEVVISAEPLPKSAVGKVLRKKLREPYWEGAERHVAGS
jgi:acyl-CoA synthetase (AMP-forming)/AMP-acid ligase II